MSRRNCNGVYRWSNHQTLSSKNSLQYVCDVFRACKMQNRLMVLVDGRTASQKGFMLQFVWVHWKHGQNNCSNCRRFGYSPCFCCHSLCRGHNGNQTTSRRSLMVEDESCGTEDRLTRSQCTEKVDRCSPADGAKFYRFLSLNVTVDKTS